MPVAISPASVAASTEMMVIDINYGKGTGEILVHFGDDPEMLAQHFVAENGLKPAAVAVIAKHVRTTIEEFQKLNVVMRPQSPTLDGEHESMWNFLEHGRPGEDLYNVQPTELPSSPVPVMRKGFDTVNDVFKKNTLTAQALAPDLPRRRPSQKGVQPTKKYRSKSSSPPPGRLNKRVTMINHQPLSPPPIQASKPRKSTSDDNQASSTDDVSAARAGAKRVSGDTIAAATDRLYSSALARKGMQRALEENQVKKIKSEQRASSFTLNPTSKSIVEKVLLRGKEQFASVGHRLFEEGRASRDRLDKAARQRVATVPVTWMCVKCSSYNDDRAVEGQLSPLKSSQCQRCGFDQRELTPFQPTLVKTGHCSVDDIGLERRKYVAAIDTYDLHEYLYSDFRRHNLHIKSLQKSWDRMNKVLTFKPELSEGTVHIVERIKATAASSPAKSARRSASVGGSPSREGRSTVPAGEWFKMAPSERLAYHRLQQSRSSAAIRHVALRVDVDEEVPRKKSVDMDKFVNQLVYEYKDRERRRQSMQAAVQDIDPNTGRPFFQPHLPARQGMAHGGDTSEIVVRARRTGRDGAQIDVFQHLVEKTELKRERGERAVAKALEDERAALAKCKVSALPKSSQILSAANERSLEEMFRLLLAGVEYDKLHGAEVSDQRRRAALICAISSNLKDFRSRLLDIRLVQAQYMIPEVRTVVDFVRSEKAAAQQKLEWQHNATGSSALVAADAPLVSYGEFKKLASKSLRKRNAIGKSYVYAPKKRPEVTVSILRDQLKEETFRPQIDKKSVELALKSHEAKPVHEVLINKGEQNKIKVALARKEQDEREQSELTFKPRLYRPPAYVVPKYRMAKPVAAPDRSPGSAVKEGAMFSSSSRRRTASLSPPRDTLASALRTQSIPDANSSMRSPTSRLAQENSVNASSLSFLANIYTGEGAERPPPLPSEIREEM